MLLVMTISHAVHDTLITVGKYRAFLHGNILVASAQLVLCHRIAAELFSVVLICVPAGSLEHRRGASSGLRAACTIDLELSICKIPRCKQQAML